MKKLFVVAAIALSGTTAFAQDSNSPETLFNGLKVNEIGVMAEGWYGFSQIGGSDAHFLGARVGAVINNQFTVGGFYQQSVNQNFIPKGEVLPNTYYDFWTAGGFVEYTVAANKLVHVSFPVFVGYGEVQLDNEPGDMDVSEANFLVIEPAALMEVNLLKNLRFNLGAGYRFTSEVSYRALDQNDLAGLRFHGGLKFVFNRAS